MTEGELGELPDWYALDRAAHRYGTPPWEFLDRPAVYMIWPNTAEGAENEAQDAINKRNQPAAS